MLEATKEGASEGCGTGTGTNTGIWYEYVGSGRIQTSRWMNAHLGSSSISPQRSLQRMTSTVWTRSVDCRCTRVLEYSYW